MAEMQTVEYPTLITSKVTHVESADYYLNISSTLPAVIFTEMFHRSRVGRETHLPSYTRYHLVIVRGVAEMLPSRWYSPYHRTNFPCKFRMMRSATVEQIVRAGQYVRPTPSRPSIVSDTAKQTLSTDDIERR